MKKILITGANSYIGTSFERYLAQWPEEYRVDTVDMVDGSWREKSFTGYDVVYHVAGIAHSDTGNVTEERKAFYYQINTDLTVETAKKAKAEGVKQFIFMSSAIVYGESAPIGQAKRIKRETPVSPANFYGDSKVQAENGLLPLNDESFKVVILRPPMIYGPGSKGNYPILSKLARKLPLFPAVKNERSLLFIGNLMEFVRLMVENDEEGVFWPQNGEYSNTTELVKEIARAHGKNVVAVPGFTWVLKLMSHCTGLVNKAFGSLSYDMELSDYPQDYRKYTLEQSIRVTEGSGVKRALVYASVASMIQQFNMENIKLLLSMGYEVDVVSNMETGNTITPEKVATMKAELEAMGVRVFHMPIPRSPLGVGAMLKSFRATRKMMNTNKYKLAHCHSPVGGLICRLANRMSRNYKKTRMIYTAHGFHFYEGAPKKNWLIYYPIEKLCSRWTDVLIAINREDYALAQKSMKAREVQYVPGIGIDVKKITAIGVDCVAKRKELGIPEDAMVLFSVGELNANKNHETVIRALAQLQEGNVYYAVAGRGGLQEDLEKLIDKLGLVNRVKLLGYRSDVIQLYKSADIFVFPSYREGLSVALMEAMTCGLPVVCSKIRGNTDLIDENGGFSFDPSNMASCKKAIASALNANVAKMGAYNCQKVQNFDVEHVLTKIRQIYTG